MLELILIVVSLSCLLVACCFIDRANKTMNINCARLSKDLELLGRIIGKLAREDSLTQASDRIIKRTAIDCSMILKDLNIAMESQKKILEGLVSKEDFKRVESDIESTIELKKRVKDERFKNMREAFGAKPNEENN